MGGFPPKGILAYRTPKRANPLKASTASILLESIFGFNGVFIINYFQN
jgi:hypothetical protein